ncbi:MAG: CxxC-x17-CxxC domain-containing protein [Nanoarchaeota archaeon]
MNGKRNRRDFGSNKYGGDSGKEFRSKQSYTPTRELHKATCAECASECEVPFKPSEGKPVYCRSCFAKRRPQRF